MNEIVPYGDDSARGRMLRPGTRRAEREGSFYGDVDPAQRANATLPEPPIGSVIHYRLNLGGKLFTYVSLRAENGLWYTTGGGTKQNATWEELAAGIQGALSGPVMNLVPGAILWRS